MQNKIIFFQSTEIGGYSDKVGLCDLFMTNLFGLTQTNLFEQIKVVVPNQAMGVWLKDRITKKHGICANVDCVTLLGPILQQIYLANNPQFEIYDFNQAKFIIYDILCHQSIECADSDEINTYLYDSNGLVDKFKAYQLASQLQGIFHEYIYLRTSELVQLDKSGFRQWQKIIWRKFMEQIGGQKTFLDIYRYFAELDIDDVKLKLPTQLFIFGLTSVYPSQLEIIQKLSNRINIYWYYQPCSHEYYGDLLSAKARAKIEQKLLRKPDLSIEDLYLTDGNPLIANLGQQSRELIELLRANDVQVYDFDSAQYNQTNAANNLLSIIQQDIHSLVYRVRPEYRLHSMSSYYADPIQLANYATDDKCVYDLEPNQVSLKVNVCHNRMREVQVMFNEIAQIINQDENCQLDDILITAPDIDDYASYLSAVFENEQLIKPDGSQVKIPYTLTGNRRHKNYKIIETVQLILQTPYNLTVNYLLEILSQAELQTNLELSKDDIELVKYWLAENNVHFGYTAADYEKYGYHNYSVHSFEQFLTNLVLGACLNNEMFAANDQFAVYSSEQGEFTPYDNLDNAQIGLANKLINLIQLLTSLRDKFYLTADEYRELTIEEILASFEILQNSLINDDDSILIFNDFMSKLRGQNHELVINLPIILQFLVEYMDDFKSRLNFNGKITCASMQYMRNLPFKYIYILGLNFGEFPSSYRPNQLSLLAQDWYIADRNYTIEDKQAFLDVILSAKQQLIMSYIGRKETDNSEIKPSPLLSLLLNTIGQSFSNFWHGDDLINQSFNFKNIVTYHSLHPFYNNSQINYAQFWQQVAQKTSSDHVIDLRWDFTQVSPLKLSSEQEKNYYNLSIKSLVNTFLYSNVNLYKVLGNNRFDNEIELDDYESLELVDTNLAKTLFAYFEKYANRDLVQLEHFLQLKGILGYQHIGQWQFAHYHKIYQQYITCRGNNLQEFNFEHSLQRADGSSIQLNLQDKIWLEYDSIIVMDSFARTCNGKVADKVDGLGYELKWRALVYAALLQEQALLILCLISIKLLFVNLIMMARCVSSKLGLMIQLQYYGELWAITLAV